MAIIELLDTTQIMKFITNYWTSQLKRLKKGSKTEVKTEYLEPDDFSAI